MGIALILIGPFYDMNLIGIEQKGEKLFRKLM